MSLLIADRDEILARIARWAESTAAIRACLLTSTRAVPNAVVDELSDYDLILVLTDILEFTENHSWIEEFGDVLVSYWDPIETDPSSSLHHSGNIVQYADGLKIDFRLWPIEMLDSMVDQSGLPAELDAGYAVLVDKEGRTDRLQPPSFTSYLLKRPDQTTYLTLVNDFFIGPTYVAKCLLRNELLPAKWCLDYDMRFVYLVPMMEWSVGCDNDWSIAVGINGKGIRAHFTDDLWGEFERTFAAADIEANWQSLFNMMTFFGRMGQKVGEHLGYAYPAELEHRVTEFVRSMQLAAHHAR